MVHERVDAVLIVRLGVERVLRGLVLRRVEGEMSSLSTFSASMGLSSLDVVTAPAGASSLATSLGMS